jgi:hypothetical protein
MLSEFNHMSVNWVDGMKISRKHFQQTDDHVEELVQDATAVHTPPFGFGILPGEKTLGLEVQCDFSQQISVELTHCNAVTPNGSRIVVSPSYNIKRVTHFKDIADKYALQLANAQTLYILISVNPYKRVPMGEPAPDENPPRHPYSRAEINLDILPSEQIKTLYLGNILIVGKIIYNNGELIYQREFIPPCTATESLPIVKDWYNRFRQSMDSLETSSYKIIEKIKGKGQVNNLTVSIGQLAERVVFQIANLRTSYRWLVPAAPPVYMCESLMRILNTINASIMAFSSTDREEVLNYFNEWTDMQQGNIERQTAQALQVQYDHYNLHHVMATINQAFSMYQQIFEKMISLEYIGKHKGESKIYIEQKVEVQQTVSQPEKKPEKSRWSPLD